MMKIKIRNLIINLKYKMKPKLSDAEYKIAGEYMMKNVDINTMEKDLLLRGMSYKKIKRVADAYYYLSVASGIDNSKSIHVKELKGGILDGIRRSKKDFR